MAQELAVGGVQRGGRRQRQREEEPDAENISALARWLLQQWGWGKLSAPVVQVIANLANLDLQTAMASGRGIPRLERLARISGHRSEVANMGRDLVRSLPPKQLVTQQFEMRFARGEDEMQELLLPHVAFAQLHAHYPQWFFSKVCNEEKQVQLVRCLCGGSSCSRKGLGACNSNLHSWGWGACVCLQARLGRKAWTASIGLLWLVLVALWRPSLWSGCALLTCKARFLGEGPSLTSMQKDTCKSGCLCHSIYLLQTLC